MKIEILNFDYTTIHWFMFNMSFFGSWIVTEKWWSDGHEHSVGIRFGSKIFERRWGNEK